ncbi:hypothetical protein B296_00058687 [Ensete ventricosum]|uniref:Uncharacterized protein n=1 Tax=Ensete ventricosum TaxID=4639 RepID=A0A426WWE7_ENSVE|nr:hypothetical protein B296_00058687 [Ensete ventricosum]
MKREKISQPPSRLPRSKDKPYSLLSEKGTHQYSLRIVIEDTCSSWDDPDHHPPHPVVGATDDSPTASFLDDAIGFPRSMGDAPDHVTTRCRELTTPPRVLFKGSWGHR